MQPFKQAGPKNDLTILWRGSLASCNYGCTYCPFAKTEDDREALQKDREALEKFVQWVKARSYKVSILFTPWGEGLIRNYYREALQTLSNLDNVPTVAIQTNLSCSLDWISEANKNSIALWTTYHPGETPHEKFLEKIYWLSNNNIRHSVGIVGQKENLDKIEKLKKGLPETTYLWINAYMPFGKDLHSPDYYTFNEINALATIDPYFELNTINYPSKGRACFAGETVISVQADGTAKRCHFIDQSIGNIYAGNFEQNLKSRSCTNNTCSCHIGYSHLKDLDAKSLYGQGFLERSPDKNPIRTNALNALRKFNEP